MSRYTQKLENGKSVAYGFDNALGYFIDVFSVPDSEGKHELLIDESSVLTGMSNGKMMELMAEYEVPQEHIDKVGLDLPL
jgi:hypothetical protein